MLGRDALRGQPLCRRLGQGGLGGREHNAVPVEAVALLRGNSPSGMTPQRLPSRVKAKSLSPRLSVIGCRMF